MKKQAFNPYLPSYEYVPDGEPYIFGDRLYVFGSHDRFGGLVYCENDYVCWSAPVDDLSDWRCDGIIYRKGQDPLNPKGKSQLWAPDVAVGKDGRYYLYYAFTFKGFVGVAVADRPEGPYEFYGHVRYPTGKIVGKDKGDVLMFDPGVLVDDDGCVYMYVGFATPQKNIAIRDKPHEGGYIVELESDMITVKQGPDLIFPKTGNSQGSGFEGHEFYEASSIRKIGGIYYFVYSSINGHELCYATAKNPRGPFSYGGVIVSNGDVGYKGRTLENADNYTANNHGGMVQVNDQWYIFYHRHTNFHQVSRQGCAEPIAIMPDGTIPQVEMTSCGLNGGTLSGKGRYSSSIACVLRSKTGAAPVPFFSLPWKKSRHPYLTQSGADREENGDQYIANMRDGAVAGFRYFDLSQTGKVEVEVRGKASGCFEVRYLDAGPVVAQIPVAVENRQESKAFSAPLAGGEERQMLYFTYRGKGAPDFLSFYLF